jgi:hypothetical protein
MRVIVARVIGPDGVIRAKDIVVPSFRSECLPTSLIGQTFAGLPALEAARAEARERERGLQQRHEWLTVKLAHAKLSDGPAQVSAWETEKRLLGGELERAAAEVATCARAVTQARQQLDLLWGEASEIVREAERERAAVYGSQIGRLKALVGVLAMPNTPDGGAASDRTVVGVPASRDADRKGRGA